MPKRLTLHEIDMVSLVDKGDNPEAHVVIHKRISKVVTKTENGKQFPASDYAYVPDPEKPTTWKLRLTSEPGAAPDPGIVGAAVAALGPGGFRGQRVEIPAGDMAGVKTKVRAAWMKAHPDKSREDLPPVIKSEPFFSVLKRFFTAQGVDPGELDEEIGMPDISEKRLEELTKRVDTLEAEKTALVKRAETVDAIAKAATVADLDKIDVGEDADLKAKAAARKAELEAETSKAKTAEFAKKLLGPLAEAFAKMTPEEQTKFMTDYRKAEDGDPVAKAMTDLVKRNADLEARLATVEKADAVEKIRKELGDHPKAGELAETVYRLQKVDADAAKAMVEEIKALTGQVKTAGLFKVLGKSGEGDGASDRLDKMAKELSTKEGISFAKAYDRVIQENSDLYTESLNEEAK